MNAKLRSGFNNPGVGFDAFARQLETRHRRDRLHPQPVEHLTQLLRGLAATVAAIGDDYRRLSRPFRIEIFLRLRGIPLEARLVGVEFPNATANIRVRKILR